MLVLLNRESLKSPLPHMTATSIMPMIPPHMGRQKPLHPSPQTPIPIWPEPKMKVIRHDAIGQHPHGNVLTRKPNQFNKRLFLKHLLASVATINHVVADLSN